GQAAALSRPTRRGRPQVLRAAHTGLQRRARPRTGGGNGWGRGRGARMTEPLLARPHTALRQYLFDLTLHGIKLGLENIQALVCAAGDPHLAYPTVHVGGTNGKGSVVAMCAAMLQAAGYRVGRFTSPHLIDVSERFLVNGE